MLLSPNLTADESTHRRTMDMTRFWGKAQPLDCGRGPQWHPLAYHSLDVAAVGEALLRSHRGLSERFSRLLGLPSEDAVPLIRYLLSLHDIGKFAKKFQAKAPSLFPECFGDDLAKLPTQYDHGAGGLRLFRANPDAFSLPTGAHPRAWRPMITAVTGHHGAPPTLHPSQANEGMRVLEPDFGKKGIEAAQAFAKQAHALLAPKGVRELETRRAKRASFALAGLAVLADWIGSKQEWFPYCEPALGLREYWSTARDLAKRAVIEAGVVPACISRHLSYRDLLGSAAAPSPMQTWACEAALPVGPALFIIEDETGSGKTEAALMLAWRLMDAGAGDGLYVALPTMATANAMFDRLADAYRHLFAPGAEPSLALAHGARSMHQGFRDAELRAGRGERPYAEVGGADDASETTASAACAAWIADDRRRALLADAGVGTIDQALLSVLPSRHQSLRLLGLLHRILILDEVHAYDAYMNREIERLLEFQAGLGGSAILLSATLPVSVRTRLTDAFAKGLKSGNGDQNACMDYPLVTVCAADGATSMKVEGRAERARTLPVRFIGSSCEALDEIEKEARAGKAVLYVRNTVDDALDAHAKLTARGIDSDLFHARFALVDRLDKERRIVRRFKKNSPVEGRKRRVLVATQVVEQSLDLDFDALITDLAPIDLLIQRAGRLWRHERKERSGQPELLVVGPEPVADADEKWFSRAFARAQYVYRNHALLWLTARALKDVGEIKSPTGLRTLIESVYGEDADQQLPDALQGIFCEALGRTGADRGIATGNLLELSKGFARDGGLWDSDVRTPTRLNDDPQVTLRLARIRDDRIVPYAHDAATDEPWRAWRLSEVSVASRRVGGEAVPSELTDAARAAKADWTHFDADKVLVVLDRTDAAEEALSGVAAAGGEHRDDKVWIRYDPDHGLEVGDRPHFVTVADDPAE